MSLVNPYYQGYGNYKPYQPDFSSYRINNNVDPSLHLGESQGSNGYGNYSPDQLNLDNPQGTPPSTNFNAGNIAGGLVSMGANAYNQTQRGFRFSGIPTSQQDSQAPPSYTAGQLQNEAFNAHPKGAQAGDIAQSALQGAAIGTEILPGWGTLAGGVFGAELSIGAGILGKNKQEEEKRKAMDKVTAAQNDYNQSDIAYRNQQNQLYDYYNRNNSAGREYNILKSRFNG